MRYFAADRRFTLRDGTSRLTTLLSTPRADATTVAWMPEVRSCRTSSLLIALSSSATGSPVGFLGFRLTAISSSSPGQSLHEVIDPCLLSSDRLRYAVLRGTQRMQLKYQQLLKQVRRSIRVSRFLGHASLSWFDRGGQPRCSDVPPA